MTLTLALRTPTVALDRRRRRRLAHVDRVTARLAELDGIRTLLRRAAERVQVGWCQDAWTGPAVGVRVATTRGVCLVSAIRVSGDDPAGQPVQRAVDLAWHTLYDDHEGVRWVAPPDVRLARVRDLARWNDHRARRLDDVVGLLHASAGTADREMGRLRLGLG